MPLNQMSCYRIVFFMSLDRTSFYWIIPDYLVHVIRSDFMSLQHIVLSKKHIDVLLNLTSCYRIVDHSIELCTSHASGSNFMSLDQKRHSIGPAAY